MYMDSIASFFFWGGGGGGGGDSLTSMALDA